MNFVYGRQEVTKWVSILTGIPDFGKAESIGIIHNNTLIAGVVYSNFIVSPEGVPISIEMSIASTDKQWCCRSNLYTLFAYPFIQLQVKRVQATTAKRNKRTRHFLTRTGFTLEGIGREAWVLGGDAAVYSMLQPECKWIENGQRFSKPTVSTRSAGIGNSADQNQSGHRVI